MKHRRFRFERHMKWRLLIVYVVAMPMLNAWGDDRQPNTDASPCPPLYRCSTPGADDLATRAVTSAPSRDNEASAQNAESIEQAAGTVDKVVTGTMLVPEIPARILRDTDALDALHGPVGAGIGLVTKGAAAGAQIYKGYTTEGAAGVARESAQVITDFSAEQLVVHGSAAVGGAFFGPPGAEVGELVGRGSSYVGSLIKKLPCGDTNVDGCVTDLEFDVYDTWRRSPHCDENGVCYDPATGTTNVDSHSSEGSAGVRQRLESDFAQTEAANDADAARLAAVRQDDSPDPAPSGFDWISFGAALLSQPVASRPQPVSASGKHQSTSEAAAIPVGWVPCSCPAKHAGSGRWFGGTLYHPEGPRC